VVELRDAPVANPAMLGAQRPDDSAGVAEAQNIGAARTLPFVVASDLLNRTETRVLVLARNPGSF
jgi:hypothetical protein